MIVIAIPGEIRGKGRPKFSGKSGRPRAYTDSKTVSAENWVKACAVDAMCARSHSMLTGAVQMNVAVTVGIPASWSKKKQQMATAGLLHPTGKPDADNTTKLICDALNGIVWKDDSQVVRLVMSKRYGEQPGAEVLVTPL